MKNLKLIFALFVIFGSAVSCSKESENPELENEAVTLEILSADTELNKFVTHAIEEISEPADRAIALVNFANITLTKKYPGLLDISEDDYAQLINDSVMKIYDNLYGNSGDNVAQRQSRVCILCCVFFGGIGDTGRCLRQNGCSSRTCR